MTLFHMKTKITEITTSAQSLGPLEFNSLHMPIADIIRDAGTFTKLWASRCREIFLIRTGGDIHADCCVCHIMVYGSKALLTEAL